jgi:hypothetical protein
MATASIIDAKQRSLVEQLATEYLQSKGWQESDYILEIPRQQSGMNIVVDAIHKDDLQSRSRGGGRSLQIHINLSEKKVTKELSFQ